MLIFILSSLIQVHHGFYTAYNSTALRPGILSAIEKAKEIYGDTRILVTGHSMGGAMAAFCALDLRVIISNLTDQLTPFSKQLMPFKLQLICTVRLVNRSICLSFSMINMYIGLYITSCLLALGIICARSI